MRKMKRMIQRREGGRKRKIVTSSVIALSVVLGSLGPVTYSHAGADRLVIPTACERTQEEYTVLSADDCGELYGKWLDLLMLEFERLEQSRATYAAEQAALSTSMAEGLVLSSVNEHLGNEYTDLSETDLDIKWNFRTASAELGRELFRPGVATAYYTISAVKKPSAESYLGALEYIPKFFELAYLGVADLARDSGLGLLADTLEWMVSPIDYVRTIILSPPPPSTVDTRIAEKELPPSSPILLLEEARLAVSDIESELKLLEERFATEKEEIANGDLEGELVDTLARELKRDHEAERAALEAQLAEARAAAEVLQYYLRKSNSRDTGTIEQDAIVEFLDRVHPNEQDTVESEARYQDIIWALNIIATVDEQGIDESGICPQYIIKAHNIIATRDEQNAADEEQTGDDVPEIGSDAPPILDARAEAESLRPNGPGWTPPIPSEEETGNEICERELELEAIREFLEGIRDNESDEAENASDVESDNPKGPIEYIDWVDTVFEEDNAMPSWWFIIPPPSPSDSSSTGRDTDEGRSSGSSWTVDEGNASTYYTDCEPGVPWTDDSASTSDSSTSSTFDNWNPDTPADTIYTDCEPGVPWTEGNDSAADSSNREETVDSSSDEQNESQPASECPIGEIPPPPPSSGTLGIPAPPPPDNSSSSCNLPESPPTVPEGTATGDPGTPLTVDCADHGGGNQDMTE